MIAVDLDDRDARRVIDALGTLDGRAIFKRVGERAADLTRERFRSQTAPDGAAWAPLRPATLGLRARRGSFGVGVLFDSGAMFRSIRSDAPAEWEATVEVGADGSFARVHQFGNPTNRMFGRALAPIPARPFVPQTGDLPAAYIPPLLEPIEKAIERALDGQGAA